MEKELPKVEVSVSLRYRSESSLVGDFQDFDDYILPIVAKIVGFPGVNGSESRRHEVELGQLRFYLIRVGNAVDDGARLVDVFDTYQETYDASTAIYQPSYQDFRPAIWKIFEDMYTSGDILLVHYIAIDLIARGQRLGLAVLKRVIRDWSSGCSLVLIKPFPLQFEYAEDRKKRDKRLALHQFTSSEKKAFSRLRKYYEQIGFKRIGRSEFYAICPNERQPVSAALDLPDSVRIPFNKLEELSKSLNEFAP